MLVSIAGAASLSTENWQGQGTYYYTGMSPFKMNLQATISGNTFTGTLAEPTYSSTVAVKGQIGQLSSFSSSDQKILSILAQKYGKKKGTFVVFTDPSDIQGGKIVKSCSYYAIVTSDSSLQGVWFYPGSTHPKGDGSLKLTCVNNLKLSDSGLSFIKKREGIKIKNGLAVMYNDANGYCTIGYGHLIHKSKIDGSASEKPYKNGITLAQALDLLKSDVSSSESTVNSNVKVPLTQYQFDSLVSFTFNIGSGGFKGSTALKDLNKGDYNLVPSDMMKWNKPSSIIGRRTAEAKLFKTGTY